MAISKISDIEIGSTTPDPTKIILSDTDYVFYLTMKDLTKAIDRLTNALRSLD